MTTSETMWITQSKHQDQQVPVWSSNQPMVGDHQWHIPAICGMMMDLKRGRVVKIHPTRSHRPMAEMEQEHHLEEVARPVEGPAMMKRWSWMTLMMTTSMRTPKSLERKTL